MVSFYVWVWVGLGLVWVGLGLVLVRYWSGSGLGLVWVEERSGLERIVDVVRRATLRAGNREPSLLAGN